MTSYPDERNALCAVIPSKDASEAMPGDRVSCRVAPHRQDVECSYACPSVRDFRLRLVRTAPHHYQVAYVHARPSLDETTYPCRSSRQGYVTYAGQT